MILRELVDLLYVAAKEINPDLKNKAIDVVENNSDFKGLKICELGDQIMKWHQDRTGKKYLLNRGADEHISIDINGKNGALSLDLSKPIDRWFEYFDITSNYGTLEHVDPGIYIGFQNFHNWTKIGGVMIHAGPPARGCPWHSPYHYETWFFKELANRCGYRHILSELRESTGRRGKNQNAIDRSLVCSVLVKEPTSKFISFEDFKSINGIEGLK